MPCIDVVISLNDFLGIARDLLEKNTDDVFLSGNFHRYVSGSFVMGMVPFIIFYQESMFIGSITYNTKAQIGEVCTFLGSFAISGYLNPFKNILVNIRLIDVFLTCQMNDFI